MHMSGQLGLGGQHGPVDPECGCGRRPLTATRTAGRACSTSISVSPALPAAGRRVSRGSSRGSCRCGGRGRSAADRGVLRRPVGTSARGGTGRGAAVTAAHRGEWLVPSQEENQGGRTSGWAWRCA